MNNFNHPILVKNSFKDMVYRFSLSKLIVIFLFLYLFTAFFFYVLYVFLIKWYGLSVDSSWDVMVYSINRLFNFDMDGLFDKQYFWFDTFTIVEQILGVILSVIFTSAIIFKFFVKPVFFQFKKKLNFDKDKNMLVVSLYNRTDFNITKYDITIYLRVYYFNDKTGKNGIHNIKLKPINSFFPFMDKHLVTRIKIDFNDPLNNRYLKELFKNVSNAFEDLEYRVSDLFDDKKLENISKNIKKLDLIVMNEAKSIDMDNDIYEIKVYGFDHKNIKDVITYKWYNSLSLDFESFSRSKDWDKFED